MHEIMRAWTCIETGWTLEYYDSLDYVEQNRVFAIIDLLEKKRDKANMMRFNWIKEAVMKLFGKKKGGGRR